MSENVKVYETIDLWTGNDLMNEECVLGAMLDGVNREHCPYTAFKVVHNCNCLVSCNEPGFIASKNQAIIFYDHTEPVRLAVLSTPHLQQLISQALNQLIPYTNFSLEDTLMYHGVVSYDVVGIAAESVKQDPESTHGLSGEADIWSCDRYEVFRQAVQAHGENLFYCPQLNLKYDLRIDDEIFSIVHQGGFSDYKNVIIAFQKYGHIHKEF